MKKVICLLCVLALLAAGGIVTVVKQVNQDKDTVTITEEAVYGDAALAEGITLNLKVHYDEHLMWDTRYEKDGAVKTDTKFQFSDRGFQQSRVYRDDPVSINVSYDSDLDLETPKEELTGLARACREIYEETEPGTETSEWVYVKDYYEYYPLFIRLALPDNEIWLDERWSSESAGFMNGEEELFETFIEFFRIPVAEEDMVEVVVDRDQSNGMMTQNASSDYLQLYSESTITEDGMCYFTLNNHTADGGAMDTSLIPGGYGLYSFRFGKPGTYSMSGVDADSLKMTYALQENITILHLTLNKEQTKLLLFTEEAGEYFLSVIDRSTMALSQRIALEGWGGIREYDDFLVILGERLSLLAVNGEGAYELRFTIPTAHPECNALVKMTTDASMDYNGEHLIVADWLMEEDYNWIQSCNFDITICGPEGIGYYGVYRNSLAVNPSAEYYRYDCLPFGDDAITIQWK